MEEVLDRVLQVLLDAVENITVEKGLRIPLGISNRHVHLSQQDMDHLFGEGYSLTKVKDLSQPGQFAAAECVTICGPKGVIEKVRILGPVRRETQIEVLRGDCFKLGVKAPVRMSGELEGSPGVTLVGAKGSVETKKGLIVAQRHIHMTLQEAGKLEVSDGEIVSIQFEGPRGGSLHNVVIRANDQSGLECHLDTEEANAFDLTSKSAFNIL